MKKLSLILFSLLSFLGFSTETEFELDKFYNVNVIGNFKATLIKSTTYKVKVFNTDENIVVENNGNELILKLRKDTYEKR